MFNKKHLVNLLGYLGIGFISGSISHGFFSGLRSIIMATIGVLLFLLSEYLTPGKKNFKELFLFGLIYALAVGMVSGGFQHFLDSPMRSLWIIPVGYFLSLLIFPMKHGEKDGKQYKYLIVGGIVSVLLTGVLYALIHILPESAFSEIGGHHGDEAIESH